MANLYRSLEPFVQKDLKEKNVILTGPRRPTRMIEVKWADQNFYKNFHPYLKALGKLRCYQVVYELKRPLSTREISLVAAAPFLAGLNVEE